VRIVEKAGIKNILAPFFVDSIQSWKSRSNGRRQQNRLLDPQKLFTDATSTVISTRGSQNLLTANQSLSRERLTSPIMPDCLFSKTQPHSSTYSPISTGLPFVVGELFRKSPATTISISQFYMTSALIDYFHLKFS
jgi:hypothetical protein